MKKLTKLLALFLVLVSVFAFTACDNPKSDEVENVIITIDAQKYEITETTTLNDYMNYLEIDGELSFTTSSSTYGLFITSVNGVKNGVGSNPCWMIYTDDANYVDTSDWATSITEGEKTYVSATMGISGIIVSDGCTYVLSYQTFKV